MKTIEPCVLVIFGASGNLSRRKLIPALFRLEVAKRLPEKMTILGCSLEPWSKDQWIAEVSDMLQSKFPDGIDEQAFERFSARLHYHPNPQDN
ncbi:MAG: glucose-6-phosphate dehydrogenase, partial [Nitrosospira sp.]